MKTQNSNNAGFSIVELMVVVAIIGVLSVIALPNFQKFQAKAKQSGAKSELTGIFTAEKSFFAEYGTYAERLADIGYAPEGLLKDDTNHCPTEVAGGVIRYYNTGFSADGGEWPSSVASPCSGVLNYKATVKGPDGNDLSALSATPTQSTFTAGANGAISTGKEDQWTIDQNRSLINVKAGI